MAVVRASLTAPYQRTAHQLPHTGLSLECTSSRGVMGDLLRVCPGSGPDHTPTFTDEATEDEVLPVTKRPVRRGRGRRRHGLDPECPRRLFHVLGTRGFGGLWGGRRRHRRAIA